MNGITKSFVLGVALAAGAAIGGASAQDAAAGYPNKTIKMIVAASAGGGSDLVGRMIAAGMESALGQKVVVENIAGAGSVAGVTALAKSVPDGYTIGTSNISAIGINPHMMQLPYEPKKDLIPIGMAMTSHYAMIVRADLPVKTVQDLIDYLKKNPNKLNYGSSGVGIPNHMAAELFKSLTDTTMTHVPYKSSGDVAAAMLQGQVDVAIDSAPSYFAGAESGKLRLIAVGGGSEVTDVPQLKGLPPIKATLPSFGELSSWIGIFAPAGVPRPIVDKLNKAMNDYMKTPAGIEQIKRAGWNPAPGTPEDLGKIWFTEYETWARVVKEAKITAN